MTDSYTLHSSEVTGPTNGRVQNASDRMYFVTLYSLRPCNPTHNPTSPSIVQRQKPPTAQTKPDALRMRALSREGRAAARLISVPDLVRRDVWRLQRQHERVQIPIVCSSVRRVRLHRSKQPQASALFRSPKHARTHPHRLQPQIPIIGALYGASSGSSKQLSTKPQLTHNSAAASRALKYEASGLWRGRSDSGVHEGLRFALQP